MNLNGVDLGADPTDVTNWSDLPGSAANGATYHVTATGEHFVYNSTVGAFVPAVASQKTFTSNIDPLVGDVLPGTLGDWAETTAGSGAITIDSAAIKFNSSGANSDKAYVLGTHSIDGGDWYLRVDIKCNSFSGTDQYAGAMVYLYDGGDGNTGNEIRINLRHSATSGRVDLVGGNGIEKRGAIFETVELDDFQTLEALRIDNTVYFFFNGTLSMMNESEEFRLTASSYFYIGDSSTGASAITHIKNLYLYKLT